MLGHFGMISPNIYHDFQGSGEQWGRDEIYPDWWQILDALNGGDKLPVLHWVFDVPYFKSLKKQQTLASLG